MEVWSTLYTEKPFGVQNKNIITYFIAAMLYAEFELKWKVYWRSLFTRKKNDKSEYEQRIVLNKFVIDLRDGEVGVVVVVLATNPSSSRSTNVVIDSGSMDPAIRLDKGVDSGSGIKKLGVA